MTVPTLDDRDSRNDDLVIVGWFAVFLFPLAAIVIGAILRGRHDRRGNPILGVSIATQIVALIAIVLILSSGNGPARATPGASTPESCLFDHNPTAAEMRKCERDAVGQFMP